MFVYVSVLLRHFGGYRQLNLHTLMLCADKDDSNDMQGTMEKVLLSIPQLFNIYRLDRVCLLLL